MLAARLAGRVGAIGEGRLVTTARGALRTEMRVIGAVHPQRLNEAVAEVVGDIQVVAVVGRAGRVDQLDVTGGKQPAAGLVVGDLLRLERVAGVVDFHIADGGDGVVIVVVDQLIGFDEHALAGGGGKLRDIHHAPNGGQAGRGDSAPDEHRGQGDAHQAPAENPAGSSPISDPGRRPVHPSSRCNSTVIPNKVATPAGNHAANDGGTTPPLPKSHAMFMRT